MARMRASDSLTTGADIASPRLRLDFATVAGLVSGFGLVAVAIAMGGSGWSFLDLPSFLIVIGGTFGVTTACFSLREMARLPLIVTRTLVRTAPDPGATALHMLRLAELARHRGILDLDRLLDEMEYEPFVHRAVGLAVDGAPAEEIRSVMQREIGETADRHGRSAGILRKAGEIAPAMGLIGTLIGLVHMLGNLEDPASIGPGMAIALLTTFYGAVLANMVFVPLAAKLERNAAEETLLANVYMATAESICRKENPRRLEMLLNAMLPPAKRINHFA
jgi:chemotaxis protein MotA